MHRSLSYPPRWGIERAMISVVAIVLTLFVFAHPQPAKAQTIGKTSIVQLTNVVRQNYGLAQLRRDKVLDQIAMERAKKMGEARIFTHLSDGKNVLQQRFDRFGENIAVGQRTSEVVLQSWMNSSGHRQNILNTKFNRIGVAVTHGTFSGYRGTLVVQIMAHARRAVETIAKQQQPAPTTTLRKVIATSRQQADYRRLPKNARSMVFGL